MALTIGAAAAAIRTEYLTREGMRARRERAEVLAREYNLPHWGMVAVVTDPELAGKSLHERLRQVGISTEDYMVMAETSEYRKFLKAWGHCIKDVIELQAMENVAAAMDGERYIRGKGGTLTPDHSLELAALKALAPPPAPAVAVQVNVGDAWNRAREQARRELGE